MNVQFNNVSAGYFETLRIPIVRGRSFATTDTANAPRALVVNETMARRYWRGGDPVGRAVRVGPQTLTVVGVARDGRYGSLSAPPRPYMYFALSQMYRPTAVPHARISGAQRPVFEAIRRQIRALDADLPIYDTITMRDFLGQAVFVQRAAAMLLGIFGVLALLLAIVGLYGVMAYVVSQRTHEMGVRLALGATPRDLRRMVVGQGVGLALLGIAIGATAAFGRMRFARALLPGISPTDPATFLGISLLLAVVAFVAAAIPAARAARVDPVIALRYE